MRERKYGSIVSIASIAGCMSDPAGYVLAGSMADTVGRRLEEFDPAWVTELLDRHPKHGFKRKVIAALHAESKAVPNGRIRIMNNPSTVNSDPDSAM